MLRFRQMVTQVFKEACGCSLHEEDTASDNELIKVFDATKTTPVPLDIHMTKGEYKQNHRGKGQYADGTVFVWLYDYTSKKYLISQRADDGAWTQSAGGGMIESDKDFKDSAIRETKEELGYTPNNLHKIKILPRGKDGITGNWLGVFCCLVENGENIQFHLQQDEVSSVQWATYDEIINNIGLINKFVTDSLNEVEKQINK